MNKSDTLIFTIKNQEEMTQFACDFSRLLSPNHFIAMQGEVGVGKSTFVRAAIQFLCQEPDLIVPSPTFTLFQQYDAPIASIIHADFYRLSSPEEVEDLGWFDLIQDAILFVEWPENIADIMPETHISVKIVDDPDFFDAREIVIQTKDMAFLNLLSNKFPTQNENA